MNKNTIRIGILFVSIISISFLYQYYKTQEPHIESLATAICDKIDSDRGVDNFGEGFEITLKIPIASHIEMVRLYGYYNFGSIELNLPPEMFNTISKNYKVKFNFRNTLRIHRHMADWNTRKNERIDMLKKQDTVLQQQVILLDSFLRVR